MQRADNKKLFSSNWGFSEGIIVGAGVLSAGFIFELAGLSLNLPGHPVNLLMGLLLVLMIIYLYRTSNDHSLTKWLAGVPGSISAFFTFSLMALCIALIPQSGNLQGWRHALGLDSVTRSWPYVLSVMWLLTSLGLVIYRNANRPHRRLFFMFHHLGLWLVLFAGGIGAGEVQKLAVQTVKGENVSEAYTSSGERIRLPFSLLLTDFNIDYFPPKLVLIDPETGAMMDKKKSLPFAEVGKTINLHGWEITVNKVMPSCVPKDGAYMEVDMPGAGSAVFVSIIHKKKWTKKEGWLFTGTDTFDPEVIQLDASTILYILKPDPKEYRSILKVTADDGLEEEITLTVNNPEKIKNWDLYQTGYDTEMGKFSQISIISIVYDPWISVVYTGIGLMLAGAVSLIFWGARTKQSNRKKE